MNTAIVQTIFQAEWPNGRFRKVLVRIGRPVQAKTREWVCPVQIFGLQKTIRVRGADALQALCLGLHLVGDLLFMFRKKGVRLKFIDSIEEVPFQAYFRVKNFRKRMEKLGRKKAPPQREN